MAFVTRQYLQLMKYEDYQFDQSAYERPNCDHNCGRRRFWKKSCWQGPDHKGKCGGETECTPVLFGDRFECTRPERAGGPCNIGPGTDGVCSHKHSACQPTLRLRAWRKRFSYLVAIFITVLIISYSFLPSSTNLDKSSSMTGSMLSPGDLSRKHSAFTADKTCTSCHLNHDENLVDWLGSAFAPQNMTEACTDCHLFEGTANEAHQGQFNKTNETAFKINCVTCHTEHKGGDFSLVNISNKTCSNCHEESFSEFGEAHPEFSKTYPYENKQSIFFDHQSHIVGHFTEKKNFSKDSFDADFAKNASENCSSCHDLENAALNVAPLSYESICMSCHEKQIKGNNLVVMTIDEASPLLLALQEDSDDADSEEVAQQLIKAISKDAMQPLIDLTGMKSSSLWRGYNAFESKLASEAWSKEESHEAVSAESDEIENMSGWFFGENSDGDESIYYRATGHNDSVLKAWVDLYLERQKNEPDSEAVTEAVSMLLDNKGPGACGKCHAAGLQTSGSWGYVSRSSTDSLLFKHKPHINLLGEKASCSTCHQFDKDIEFETYFKNQGADESEYERAFVGIKKKVCTECHSVEKIDSNCTVCHQYHGKSSYKEGLISKLNRIKRHADEAKVTHDE